MRSFNVTFVLALIASAIAWQGRAETFGPFETSAGPVTVERMSGSFEFPWAFAFLPQPGAMLVTEKAGALRVVSDGRISAPVQGVPRVRASGQGGLLDVALDPAFAQNSRVFLSYSEPVSGGTLARTALMSATLADAFGAPRLENAQVIFRQEPPLRASRHFGSRISFGPDGKLYLTLGDRANRDLVQDLSNHLGKVVRLELDGAVPADNPFIGRAGARPEIWSYGHRNAQGAAIRPSDGAYFTVSHGAAGGDEVNLSAPGQNFGWPEVSYGEHYSGASFPAATRSDVVPPVFYWDPSIAPSGAMFYSGDLFPQWRGDLFVGALKYRLISRLGFDGDVVTGEERLLSGEFGRVRDLRQGPDGAIWFTVDESGAGVYRITPAQ